MPDEMPRRRTNLHDPRMREREEPEPRRFGFTGFQITVCLLCIFAAVGVRMAGGSTLTKAQAAVSQALGDKDAGGQLQSVFHALKAYFPDMKEVFQSAASGSAASGGSQTASDSAASGGSQAASGSAASSGGSQAASGSAASSAGSQTASQTASTASTAVSSGSAAPGVTNVRTAGGAA